jgi:hypothetical protein
MTLNNETSSTITPISSCESIQYELIDEMEHKFSDIRDEMRRCVGKNEGKADYKAHMKVSICI